MKRILIAVLVALSFCFAGCDSGKKPQSEVNSTAQVEQSSQIKVSASAPYKGESLQKMVLMDVSRELTVDVSGNNHLKTFLAEVEYFTHEEGEMGEVKYILALKDMDLRVMEGGVLNFVAEGEVIASLTASDDVFSYLDTLFEGGMYALNGYTADQTVQVFNGSNAEAELTDKEGFLTNLQGVTLIKLTNKAHYETGDATYTIKIGDDIIVVYEVYVTVNGNLYGVCQGNFNFLKVLKFNVSSGELPWL